MNNTIFKYSTAVILLSLCNNLIAQGPPGGGNVPPVNIGEKNINQLFVAPEVSQLLKVNFIPINLYTGKLNLEIPIYEIRVGDISVPISLKYNSEGIKIEEESSNVGTGWVLQAGGSVNKMIRDIEDRSTYLRTFQNPSGIGFMNRIVAAGNLVDITNANLYYFSNDLMPDLFFATAPNLTSKFYFDRSSNNISIKEVDNANNKILPGNSSANVYNGDLKSLAWVGTDKVFPTLNQAQKDEIQQKIDYLFQTYKGSDYENFTIINPIGVKYKFETSDVNVSFPTGQGGDLYYGSNPAQLIYTVSNFLFEKYNIQKGTWHLDEITDTSNKKVHFQYNTFNSSIIKKYPNKMSEGTVSLSNQGGNLNEDNGFLTNLSSSTDLNKDKSFYSMNALYHYVQKINWDNGEIEFLYETNREDVSSKNALSKIIVRDKQFHIIKEYLFIYSYLSTGDSKRLKLEKIDTKENNLQKTLYNFSYYENNNLPSQNSFKTDFLGYFNNSSLSDNLSYENYIPKLYFVKGRKNLSITPFYVNGSYPLSNGVRNIEANNYSSIGLLKSIRNRAGGYNEFTYENNTFRFYNQNIIGGGSRILEQTIKEGNGSERKIKYKYLDENGNSSGAISNIPKFADITKIKTENGNDLYTFRTQLRSSSNIELTDGAFVGYERVTEEEEGKGYIEYIYTSPRQFSNNYPVATYPQSPYLNEISNSSFFPGDIFIENDKTGKLISRKVFDNNSNLLEVNTKQYTDKVFSTKDYTTRKQLSNYTSGTTFIYDLNFQLINSKNLLSTEETIEYFDGKQIKSISSYTYTNSSNPFLTSSKRIDPTNNSHLTTYKYASDKNNQLMVDKNMIGIPLETITSKTIGNNTKTISKVEVIYPQTQAEANAKTQELVLPLSVLSYDISNLSSSVISEITYDKYDTKGNILQYTAKDGIPTAIVWGYNNTKPIAKVQNATHAQLVNLGLITAIVNASDQDAADPANEPTLITVLDNFRKNSGLSAYQVSTYTYDPLIGVTSVTPPSGIREVYIYDTANRLKEIRHDSKTGNLVKEFKYNYKN
ncbi:hypothetical protein [Chryseobacterium sp. LAM-KRS1]|uniref:hypothetical protein n=1 Tax=Chryseobacterium sp. LAM-KRS1 TaxID=2715754 RepID=UPI001552C4A5|nr:hypothetical protein [Chryseobacterium sp. LAM-KRS1]